jgi:hypothetical protein
VFRSRPNSPEQQSRPRTQLGQLVASLEDRTNLQSEPGLSVSRGGLF